MNSFTSTFRLRLAYQAQTAAIALRGIPQALLFVLATESIVPILMNTKICTRILNGMESSTPVNVKSDACRNFSNVLIFFAGGWIVFMLISLRKS